MLSEKLLGSFLGYFMNKDEEVTMMDDLIRRRSVIRLTWEEPAYYDPINVLTELREKIKALPPVERKIGEWQTKIVKQFCAPDCWYPGIFAIEGSWNEKEGSWLEKQGGFCSECGKQDEDYNSHNYCPLCGIKMRGEENATR